jgi:hypothetical protein
MNPSDEDALDQLLRQSFDRHVPDQGFSDRVMQQLPPRRRRSNWPLIAGIVAGVVACWLVLLTAPIARTGWQDWFRGDLSASAIVMLVAMTGMSLLALGWVLAEAEDR